MNDQTPYFPFLLADDPGAVERARGAAEVGGATVPTVEDLPADAPIAYVAYERERIVAGWLWWSDQHAEFGHVPNAFDPVARAADGVTLVVDVPWLESLREATASGTAPSRAVLDLMGRSESGDVLLPAQSPFRAPSLEHLRVIAGVRDYEAAREAFRADHGVPAGGEATASGAGHGATPGEAAASAAAPAAAPAAEAAAAGRRGAGDAASDRREAAAAGEADEAALAAATADAPELAAPGPGPATAAPTPAAPARRGFWARLFGRRR